MPGLESLDVGIGVTLFFLIVSLICSALLEMIEVILKGRAQNLEKGIRELLDDPTGQTLVASVINHGQVASLYRGNYHPDDFNDFWSNLRQSGWHFFRYWSARNSLPSYIPSAQFATALIDVVARGRGDWPYPVSTGPVSIAQLRRQIPLLPSAKVQRALLSALDHAGDDLGAFKENIEHWFDGSMDRVSGWYKRRTQVMLFILGLVAAFSLNLDALTVMDRLSQNKVMRAAFVAQAERISPPTDASQKSVSELRDQLTTFGAPIGWINNLPGPQSCRELNVDGSCKVPIQLTYWQWMKIILGWVVTAGAVTLGAPFWFDVLNKFMVIRSTVKPHEKSPEESSEDRQNVALASFASEAKQRDRAPPASADTEEDPTGPPVDQSTLLEDAFIPETWKAGFVNVNEVTV